MTQQLLTPGIIQHQKMFSSSSVQPERREYPETSATTLPRQEYYNSENMTAQGAIAADLSLKLEILFIEAKAQYFEDGMESAFTSQLIDEVRQYGNYAIAELAHVILHRLVDDEVAAEALRQLGHIEHPPTYNARLWLLEKSLLTCTSAMVRDGALLGIALVDDRQAIPYLRRALHHEQSPELRESIEQVLEQLENV